LSVSHSSKAAPRAKPRRPAAAVAALPSREELLAFIQARRRRTGNGRRRESPKRDIARAFGVKGDDKTALKRLIKDLEADGAVVRGRKVLARAGRLPAMVVAEVAARDRDGELIARPVRLGWPRRGAAHPGAAAETATRLGAGAGLGARVLMRVEFDPEAGPKRPPTTAALSRF